MPSLEFVHVKSLLVVPTVLVGIVLLALMLSVLSLVGAVHFRDEAVKLAFKDPWCD